MSEIVISMNHVSKQYRLGEINTGTISHDLAEWFNNKTNKIQKGEEYFDALDDICLEVKQGEVLGIIGKNGAGKSTLLKIISRITSPTRGEIKYKGKVASLLEVGTGMHPEMTARENIYLNGALLGMKKVEIEQKFDEIIAFAGCEKFVDTPIKRFSSGMRVRLGFAVAAYLEPDILIVDEVLAVGDIEFQQKAIGKIGEITKESKRTILFVSHNMAAVKSLCTRSLLLENGRISKIGDTETIIDAYRSANQIKNQPLANRKDRYGDGTLRFTSVEFLTNSNNTDGRHLISAEPARIVLGYQASEPIFSNNVNFSILFKDHIDNQLFTCATRHVGNKFENIKQQGKVVLEINTLPLLAGEYKVDLYCKISEIVADHIVQAISFTVLENDVFGTGIVPSKHRHGPFYVSHNWRVGE